MSEDPTRATRSGGPSYGSVGPNDPHADPATDPGMRPVGPPAGPDGQTVAVPQDPDTAPVPTTPPARRDPVAVGHSRTGGLWTGLILSAIVGIFLLVFILQNNVPVVIEFLGLSGALPLGVALLLAAIAGLLLVAIPGGLRILQLRRLAKGAGRQG
ncbi:lipopolysaccharide assembly protein LapA domain-containing protein [Pseudonocardia oceani]|nr:lipopolysaccharide assembly protein LapA domain-containing protein [Pseudonocardia oceani]